MEVGDTQEDLLAAPTQPDDDATICDDDETLPPDDETLPPDDDPRDSFAWHSANEAATLPGYDGMGHDEYSPLDDQDATCAERIDGVDAIEGAEEEEEAQVPDLGAAAPGARKRARSDDSPPERDPDPPPVAPPSRDRARDEPAPDSRVRGSRGASAMRDDYGDECPSLNAPAVEKPSSDADHEAVVDEAVDDKAAVDDEEVERCGKKRPCLRARFAGRNLRVSDVKEAPVGLLWRRAELEVPDMITGGCTGFAIVDVARDEHHEFLRSAGLVLRKREYEDVFGFPVGGTQPGGKIVRLARGSVQW